MRGFLDLVQVNCIGALTCVNRNAGYGPIREGEWNYVQFRPNGLGLRQEDGFLDVPVLVPVRASPVPTWLPSVVRGSFVVKF